MTEEKKAECVLRLFGVPDAAVKEAAGGFSPQWKAEARWKSRGAETLVALSAQNPAGLKKAAQALREKFSADLYGAGETTLAEAAVQELERHDRLLICSDAAAGTLLEARLETIAGAERVFDFGALSYAHPKTGAKIEQQAAAHLPADTTDPVRRALAKAQAARRVVGCDLAAGCAEREGDCVLVLNCKKGCWLRTVPLADRPALWLLDMIRRAACDLPQAAGTGFLPARKAARTAQPEAAPPRPAGAGGSAGAGRAGRALHRRGMGVHGRQLLRAAPAPALPLGRRPAAFGGCAVVIKGCWILLPSRLRRASSLQEGALTCRNAVKASLVEGGGIAPAMTKGVFSGFFVDFTENSLENGLKRGLWV